MPYKNGVWTPEDNGLPTLDTKLLQHLSAPSPGAAPTLDPHASPGDEGFNWNNYDEWKHLQPDVVGDAKQTLAQSEADYLPLERNINAALTDQSGDPSQGERYLQSAMSSALPIAAATAPLMLGGAAKVLGLGPTALKVLASGGLGYEGYQHGGMPGAVAGVAAPWMLGKIPLPGKLGRIASSLMGLAPEEAAAAEGAGAEFPSFEGAPNSIRPRVSTEVPYAEGYGSKMSGLNEPEMPANMWTPPEAPASAAAPPKFGKDLVGYSPIDEMAGSEGWVQKEAAANKPIVDQMMREGQLSGKRTTGGAPKMTPKRAQKLKSADPNRLTPDTLAGLKNSSVFGPLLQK